MDLDSAIVAVDGTRGHLFVATQIRTMNTVDTRTGVVLASWSTDAIPLRGALAEQSGRVFAANVGLGAGEGRPGQAQGSLSVFDAVTGTGYLVCRIGYSPTGLVVDQTTRRLFVTTFGTIADNNATSVAGTVLVFDLRVL